MNSDIRLSVGFFDHPKIIKLERQLQFEGVAALISLWLWAAQNRPSGILSNMNEEDIEIAARWKGVPRTLNDTLTALKLLDAVNGVYQIHDWQEHNAWQSDAENRSNASRLSRMAKTYPELYKILEDAGIRGLSRDVYGMITASNDPKTTVEQLLRGASSPFLTSPCLSAPLPSLPFKKEKEPSQHSGSLSGPNGPDVPTTKIDIKEQEQGPQPPFPEDSEAYRLAVFMRDTLKANIPTLKEPNLQKWAQTFAIALRNDERMKEPPFVAAVIKWACADNFWRANIQSPDKLRQKFDQLTAKMEIEAEKARTTSKTGKWQSPAARRVEANQEACSEAEKMLFGSATQTGVTYDAS